MRHILRYYGCQLLPRLYSSVQLRNLYSTRGATLEFSFVEKTQQVWHWMMMLLLRAFLHSCRWCYNKNVSKNCKFYAQFKIPSRLLFQVDLRTSECWVLDELVQVSKDLNQRPKYTRFVWTKVWLEIVKAQFSWVLKTLFLKGPKRHCK
jgi:hypothetical protein